jgi:hypothetical protein
LLVRVHAEIVPERIELGTLDYNIYTEISGVRCTNVRIYAAEYEFCLGRETADIVHDFTYAKIPVSHSRLQEGVVEWVTSLQKNL